MNEAGVLVGVNHRPIYWHLPTDRSGAALPDSRDFWDVIWEHRGQVIGFAHSHPGSGIPGPSLEDLTSFAANESGLGRRLKWWITSSNAVVEIAWVGPGNLDYAGVQVDESTLPWLTRLRDHSQYYRLPREPLNFLMENEQCQTHE